MEFLGFDIGNSKTVIASSRENGKLYCDEMSKKSIKTVMERSRPVRRFGNSVNADVEELMELRSKCFRDNLNIKEERENTLMYFGYLNRIIALNTPGNPPINMAIPEHFSEKDRRILASLAKTANVKLESFITDITASAAFACIRRESTPNRFLVFDFGYSKTTAGFFSFEENILLPLYTKSVRIGAKNFDEKLINFVFKKYSIEQTKLNEERFLRNIDRIKKTLNATEQGKFQFNLSDSTVEIVISKDEYRNVVQDELNELKAFIDLVFEETHHENSYEIIGGNAASFLVHELLETKGSPSFALDPTNSVAIGSALSLACQVVKTRFTIKDILCREISVKIDGENVKPALVFEKNYVIGGNSRSITCTRNGPFALIIYENDEEVSRLEVQKDETPEAENINIEFGISKLGTIDVLNVNGGTNTDYKYITSDISFLDQQALAAMESKYREEESQVEKIGEMRNNLENMAVSIADIMECKFENIYEYEEIEKAREIGEGIFELKASATMDQEKKVTKEVEKKLQFVTDKLEKFKKTLIGELNDLKALINEFRTESSGIFTPSFYRLQGLYLKIEDIIKNGLNFNLYTASNFDAYTINEIKREVPSYLDSARSELEQKRKQEELKKQEEEKKKEEQLKKQEESEKNDEKQKEEENNKEKEQKNQNNKTKQNKDENKKGKADNKETKAKEQESELEID